MSVSRIYLFIAATAVAGTSIGLGATRNVSAASLNISSRWVDQIVVPDKTDNLVTSVAPGTCVDHEGLHPCDGEEGHYAAIRLVPNTTPLHVQEFEYALLNEYIEHLDFDCRADLEHEVFVFVGDASSKPDSNPIEIERHTIPAASSSSMGARWIHVSLLKPIRLDAGEALYVAVELPGDVDGCTDGGESLCLYSCPGDDDPGTNTFWSNDVAPDYPWQPLSDFGLSFDGVGTMYGFTQPSP